jgi:hypothetical protein
VTRVREQVAAPAAQPAPAPAPVPHGPSSSNPAREVLAALRTGLRRPGRGRAAALQELEARADDPEWRSRPAPDPDAPAPAEDVDPRTAARALADPALGDGPRASSVMVPPWSFPFPQAPDERLLRAAFAGQPVLPTDADAGPDDGQPTPEAKLDEGELKQAGARPQLAQHRPPERQKAKPPPPRDDKKKKPAKGDKIEPRDGLTKDQADKLEAQRHQAEKDLAGEPKLDAKVPKLEAKKSKSLEEEKGPPPKPGAGGAGGGGAGGGGAGGGGADADLAAWKARQDAKVSAIQAPPPASDAERYTMTFQEGRTKHKALTNADKQKAMKDAEKAAVPKDGPDNTPKFPDPDEVAGARKLVENKAKRKLSPQPLLDMSPPSPLGNQPLVGMGLRLDQEGNTHIVQEIAVDDKGRQLTAAEIQAKKDKGEQVKTIEKELVVVDEATKDKPGKDQIQIKTPKANESIEKNLEALKTAGAAKQADLKKRLDVRGATLSDDRQTPPIAVPDSVKVDVGDVIAKLLAQGETTHAIEVVEKARGAFAKGAMTTAEAAKFVPTVAPIVKTELQKVADAAGVTKEALDKKIEDEKKQALEKVAEKRTEVQSQYDASVKEIEANRQEVGGTISNLFEDMERRADEQAAAAKGGVDPVEVRKKAKQYKTDYNAIVQHWRTEYKRATEQRKTNIGTETRKQMQAFAAAAEIDYQQIDLQLGIKTKADRDAVIADPTKPGYLLYTATQMWLDKANRERKEKAGKLTTDAETEGKRYADEMETAGEDAADKIDDWADRRIGRERGWWARLIQKIVDWLSGYRQSTRKWNDIAVQDNLANLAKDNLWVARVQMNFNESLTQEEVEADESLNEEQKAMMKVLVASKGKDSVGALAAGLVARISQQQRPYLLTKFNEEVMTWTSWSDVQRIGEGEGKYGNFARIIADNVYRAGVDQVGTNEDGIFKALEGLTPIQGRAVELAYKEFYKRDMRSDLKSELHDFFSSGSGDYDRSIQLLEGNEAASIAVELHQAMHETFLGTGWGTDNERMHALMKGKTPVQVAAIRAEYKRLYGKDLIAEAHDELDDGWSTQHDVQRFDAYVASDARKARTIEADQAMRGSVFFGLRTDKKQLEGVYKDIDKEVEQEAKQNGWSTDRVQREIAARYAELDDDYEQKYGADFPKDQRESGESALRTSMRQSFTHGSGKGAYNLTTSTGDLDLLLSYNDVGRKKDSPDIKKVFQQHRAEVSTAKIQTEHRSFFYADDKEIDKALNAPSEAAYRDNLRDESLKLDKARDKAFADAREAREKELAKEKDPAKRKEILKRHQEAELKLKMEWAPTGDKYADKMRKAKKDARAGAERDAGVTFAMMEQTWDQRYKGWNKRNNFGEDKSFTEAVKGDTGLGWMNFDTSVDFWGNKRTAENDKTLALLKGKGFISEEDKLYFAIKGGGTDEEIAKEVFAETDSVEAAELLRNLGTNRLGITDPKLAEQKARAWVQSDFSGREGQDQEIAMMGVPRTPEEHTAIARRRLEMERNSGPQRWAGMADTLGPLGVGLMLFPPTALLGAGLTGGSLLAKAVGGGGPDPADNPLLGLELTLQQFERVEAQAQKLRLEGKGPGHPEWDKIDSETAQLKDTLQRTVDIHRAQVDALTDVVTNIVTAVVTIAVIAISILAAPVTGGASAVAGFAAMTAVIGAVAATVTNIAVKMALKGDAYGWEEIGYDAAVGLVEAVASGLTAGLGDKFLKVGFLAKMAQGGLISRLAAHGLANAAEGVIQALPGALAGNVLNDELMRGPNPMAAVLMGTVTQVGMAGGMSGAMGGLFGGIRKPKQFITPGASQYDDLFHAYQKQKPGATHADFRADLHTTILKGDHPSLGKKELADVARETMLASADKETQKAFKKVKVEVVTPEEFTALTKSKAKGEAVVLFRNGEPTVVVKAGTDFKDLRREVPHLMQSVAEDTKKLVAKLDESAMRNWPNLPIEQQVDLYKTKFELEIQAHEKMLADLDTKRVQKQLGEAGVEAEREYLEATLKNLRKKAKEVDAIDVDAIKAGTKHPPEGWDKPPRLFTKKTPGEPEVKVPVGDVVDGVDAKPKVTPEPGTPVKSGFKEVEPPEVGDLKPYKQTGEPRKWRLHAEGYPEGELDALLKHVVEDGHDPSIPRLHPDSPLAKQGYVLVATPHKQGPRFTLEFKPLGADGLPLPQPKDGHYWKRPASGGQAEHVKATNRGGKDLPEIQSQKYKGGGEEGFAEREAAKDWPTKRSEAYERATGRGTFKHLDSVESLSQDGKKLFEAIDALSEPPARLTDKDKAILSRWTEVYGPLVDRMEKEEREKLFDDLVAVFQKRKVEPLADGAEHALTEAQDEQFRRVMRKEMGEFIAKQPPDVKAKMMADVLSAAQNLSNADKGAVFAGIMRGDLDKGIAGKPTRIKDINYKQDIPDHPGRGSADRQMDDAWQLHGELGTNGPNSGKWVVEYKGGDYKTQQSLDYLAMFVEPDGSGGWKVKTSPPEIPIVKPKEGAPSTHQMDGLITVFADPEKAKAALRSLANDEARSGIFNAAFKGKPPKVYIGYVIPADQPGAGTLHFLTVDNLPPAKTPKKTGGGGGGGGAGTKVATDAAEKKTTRVSNRKKAGVEKGADGEPVVSTEFPSKEGAAAHVPGSGFKGYKSGAAWRPDEVANDAANALGAIPDCVPIPGDPPNRFKVKISESREITVRVISRSVGENELADVAQYAYYKHSKTAVVQVSEHATAEQIERAMAHEVGELRQSFKRTASADDLLKPGTKPHPGTQMSPHDAGRVAELEWLTRKIKAEPGRDDLKRELHALIEDLGLRKGFAGADERLALVKRKLSPDAMGMLEPMRVSVGKLPPADLALVKQVRKARRADVRAARRQGYTPARAMIDLKRPGDPPGPLSKTTLRQRAKEARAAREATSQQTLSSYKARKAAGTITPVDSPMIGGGASLSGLGPDTLLVDDLGRWHKDRSKNLAQTARQLDGVKAAHLGDPSQAARPGQRVPLEAVQSWEDFRAAQGPVLNGKAELKLGPGDGFTMVVKMNSGEVLELPVTGTPVIAAGFPAESVPGAGRLREGMIGSDLAAAKAQTAAAETAWNDLKAAHPGKVFLGDEANLVSFDPKVSNEWIIAGTGGTSVSTAEIILEGNPGARVKMVGSALTPGLATNPQYLGMQAKFGARFETITGVNVGTLGSVGGKIDLAGHQGDAVVSALGGRNRVPPAIEKAVQDHLAVPGNKVKGVALRDTDGYFLGYRLVFEPSGHKVDVTGSASRFPPLDIEFSPKDRKFMRSSSASDAPAESGNFDGGFAASAEQAARYRKAKSRGTI